MNQLLASFFSLSLLFCYRSWGLETQFKLIKYSSQPSQSHSPVSVNFSKGLQVVVFLSSTCPCSNSHIEELKSLQTLYPKVVFTGIHSNADETLAQGKLYFNSLKLPFSVYRDSEQKMANNMEAFKTPHVFVIQDGNILYNGGVSNSHTLSKADKKLLRDALNDISMGLEVKVKQSRSLGCSIARG